MILHQSCEFLLLIQFDVTGRWCCAVKLTDPEGNVLMTALILTSFYHFSRVDMSFQ